MRSGWNNIKKHLLTALLITIGLLVFAPGVLAAELTYPDNEINTIEKLNAWIKEKSQEAGDHTIIISESFSLEKDSNNGDESIIFGDKTSDKKPEGTFTLTSDEKDLYTISRGKSSANLIQLSSKSTLLLKDITIDGGGANTNPITTGSAAIAIDKYESSEEVNNKTYESTLTIGSDVEVKNNHSTSDVGGGIYNGGNLILAGGTISGNKTITTTTNAKGGGVYNTGNFIMESGSITDNIAIYNATGGSMGQGGGVCNEIEDTANTNRLDVTFTMNDGTISGNKAISNGSHAEGGGVYNDGNVTFTMNGGLITDNTAESNSPSHYGYGGGVYNYYKRMEVDAVDVDVPAVFNMSGGIIGTDPNNGFNTGNKADIGGGIFNYVGKFTMTNGSITGNKAAVEGDKSPDPTDGSQPGCGGGVYNYGRALGDYPSAGQTWIMKAILDIQGGTISNNEAEKNGGGVFNQVYVDKTPDSDKISEAATVSISGEAGIEKNNAKNGAGLYNADGFVNIASGTITGNTAAENGGGIFSQCVTDTKPDNRSLVEMTGGSISSNEAALGGGVYNDGPSKTDPDIKFSSFHLSGAPLGGVIENNTAEGQGGGIFNKGNLSMSAGKISKNTAVIYGAGVLNQYEFTMTGGTIDENTGATNGGGVSNHRNFKLMGGEIKANKAGFGGGVYSYSEDVDTSFTMEDGEITGNTATAVNGLGGGILISKSNNNSTNTISGGTIKDNKQEWITPISHDVALQRAVLTLKPDKKIHLGTNPSQGVSLFDYDNKRAGEINIEGTLTDDSRIFMEENANLKAGIVIATQVNASADDENAGCFNPVTDGTDYYNVVPKGSSNEYILTKGATVKVTLDGKPWAEAGKKLHLYQGTDKKAEGITDARGVCGFSPVADGTYDIYDASAVTGKEVNTGKTITIEGYSGTATVAYHTLTLTAIGNWQTTKNAVSVSYGDDKFDEVVAEGKASEATANIVVLADKEATLTSTSEGADNYKYKWYTADDNNPTETEKNTYDFTMAAATTIKCESMGTNFSATIMLNKDDAVWKNKDIPVSLKQVVGTEIKNYDGKRRENDDEVAHIINFDLTGAIDDPNNLLSIYVNGVDTGQKIGVDANYDLNFYTLDYAVKVKDEATDLSSISATYNGMIYREGRFIEGAEGAAINIGDVFLGSGTLALTAKGEGADTYDCAWTVNEKDPKGFPDNTYVTVDETGKLLTFKNFGIAAYGEKEKGAANKIACEITGTRTTVAISVSLLLDGNGWLAFNAFDSLSLVKVGGGEPIKHDSKPKPGVAHFDVPAPAGDAEDTYKIYVNDIDTGQTTKEINWPYGGIGELYYYTSNISLNATGPGSSSFSFNYMDQDYDSNAPIVTDAPESPMTINVTSQGG